jgi:hypothetical protein
MKNTKPLSWAKLDPYDYKIIHRGDGLDEIWIRVSSLDDAEVADLSTEITANDGNIYVEGHYYKLRDMYTIYADTHPFAEIIVSEQTW